jgi:hypothetical protein
MRRMYRGFLVTTWCIILRQLGNVYAFDLVGGEIALLTYWHAGARNYSFGVAKFKTLAYRTLNAKYTTACRCRYRSLAILALRNPESGTLAQEPGGKHRPPISAQ